MNSAALPRLLIIDDLFGRTHADCRNEERSHLCGQYLIEDITGDEVGKGTPQKIKSPIAQAVFYRGQKPRCATIGDWVENDLDGILRMIREGWDTSVTARKQWSMVLLDLCFYTGLVTERSDKKVRGMPEGVAADDDPRQYFGLSILQAIHTSFPELPVVILSSKPREEVSRDFAYKGALGFLPREEAQSPELLQEFIWWHGLMSDPTETIIGGARPTLYALRAARRAAAGRKNILIWGERGTGKELLAKYIHLHGPKGKAAPLITVHSANLSKDLYASELFGIEKKVATGVEGREGSIKEANGGDLFFDEIGDMLAETQSGILRVLEYREVTPVGSRTSFPVDVRFLSATNIYIEEKAALGYFRFDLLDRLREGGTIVLPPLRERKEDLPLLVEKFVREAEAANPRVRKRQIESDTMDKICSYDWPGNIRELRSSIYRAINDHPDVEHFVPRHLHLPEIKIPNADTTETLAETGHHPNDFVGIDSLIKFLKDFRFDPKQPDKIAGQLSKIESAYARFLAEYLKAALDATRQPTPQHPQGEIRIHPAIKLMTGDSSLTASKAADVIKRLLNICPQALGGLLEDPTIKEAHEIALRLRPRQPKKKIVFDKSA